MATCDHDLLYAHTGCTFKHGEGRRCVTAKDRFGRTPKRRRDCREVHNRIDADQRTVNDNLVAGISHHDVIGRQVER